MQSFYISKLTWFVMDLLECSYLTISDFAENAEIVAVENYIDVGYTVGKTCHPISKKSSMYHYHLYNFKEICLPQINEPNTSYHIQHLFVTDGQFHHQSGIWSFTAILFRFMVLWIRKSTYQREEPTTWLLQCFLIDKLCM